MLLHAPSPDPSKPITEADAQFAQQTLNKLSKEGAIAEQFLAGGGKGYDSAADTESDTVAWGKMKWINSELGLISDFVKKVDATTGEDIPTDQSLAQQIWAIRNNQVTTSLESKLQDIVWKSCLRYQGIPADWTPENHVDAILKELEESQKSLDGMSPFDNTDVAWKKLPLGSRVSAAVSSHDEYFGYVQKSIVLVEELKKRVDKEFDKLPDGELKRGITEFLERVFEEAEAGQARADAARREKDGLTQDQIDDINAAKRGPI